MTKYELNITDFHVADLEIVHLDNLNETDVLVRSDQYFATLATRLDSISQRLKKSDGAEHDHLQKIVDELLYLQGYYKIKKKK